MNQDMSAGFLRGSGIDPNVLKVVLLTVSTGAILVVFGWVMVQIIAEFSEERLTSAQALWSGVKATVVVCFLLAFLFQF
ncbi:DUF3262 family protein [Variovorax sp. ZS18.2.2]|uniref:DUF3262 family protein n=1 Tax=Variovorax sp. ZS18.2.2 TaxID=2971255 RepID=UPI00215182BB|nr:DUF3262 family protein [Variovorax sp. ZS18.2.2]MCR6480984.1 DUF3262 family protein [Variovorax sp. ZS18.2.2]